MPPAGRPRFTIAEERGGGDPHNVQIARCDWNPSLDGKRLDEVAISRGLKPTIPNAADSALWLIENGGCAGVFHAISEADVQRVLKYPASMVVSDGDVQVLGRGSPHPRFYGTFPRVIGHYVRDVHLFSLEDAVRKMTSAPAHRIGIRDRGEIRQA